MKSIVFIIFTVFYGWVGCRKKFACAMWEFSYLVRRTPPESEYFNWNKVLNELIERGYNCVRIDAFPHLISHALDHQITKNYTILPQEPQFMWGNHHNVSVDVLNGVKDFLLLAKKKNLYIGLSTWMLKDSLGIVKTIASPSQIFEMWKTTLSYLKEFDVLTNVLWVDLLNEFPMGMWGPGVWKDIFGVDYNYEETILLLETPWTNETIVKMNKYFNEVISPLKKLFPELKFLYSFQSMGSSQLVELDTSSFDMGEVHIWIMDDLAWFVESLQVLLFINEPKYPLCSKMFREFVIGTWYPLRRDEFKEFLMKRLHFWKSWKLKMQKTKKDFNLFTTEAWAPINYFGENQSEWDWIRDVAELGVELALENDWEGVCSSNFCQPHFKFWDNIEWHKKITNKIVNF